MSSSSVYQGLQSCLEPRVIESHVLRLKLALPRSNFSSPSDSDTQNQEKPITNNNECNKKGTVPNVGGGSGSSFLQALGNTTHCNKTEEQVYVHPTVKRSSSVLSEKSLEMCTESLGNETGSNAGENSDDFSLFSFDSNTCFTRHNTDKNCVSKRVNRACSFPPPLTSMGGVQVRPHREGGRLILEAVASPSPPRYFHVERSKGRLRLCLFESFLVPDGDDDEVKEGIEEEEEEEEEAESEKIHEGFGEEDNGEEEELEEILDNVEDEMGVTKFTRPRSRCKESGNRDIFGECYFELPSLPLCL